MDHKEPTSFKTGIFWRQSRWNGRKSIPVILEIKDKTLIITTHKDDRLQIPLARLSAKFSRLGTMTLSADGRSYIFVGSNEGNILAPSFTDGQLAELRKNNSWDGADRMWRRGIVSDLVTASDKNKCRLHMLNSDSFRGIKILEQWETIFRKAGVPVQAKKSIFYSYEVWQIGVVLMFLGGFIVWLLQSI